MENQEQDGICHACLWPIEGPASRYKGQQICVECASQIDTSRVSRECAMAAFDTLMKRIEEKSHDKN